MIFCLKSNNGLLNGYGCGVIRLAGIKVGGTVRKGDKGALMGIGDCDWRFLIVFSVMINDLTNLEHCFWNNTVPLCYKLA